MSSLQLAVGQSKSAPWVNLVSAPTPALTDLMGGRVDFYFADVISAAAVLKSNKLRVLAVMTARRVFQLPETPTFGESGLAGFDSYLWNGVVARAGTPNEIVQQLGSAIVASLNRADVAGPLTAMGAQTVGDFRQHFSAMIANERALWARVVAATGIKLDL